MSPIQLRQPGNPDGIPPEHLLSFILEKSRTHQAQGHALVFAFIFYDRSHAQVARVLDDRRFYDSLDEVSGRYITVFYIDSPTGNSDPHIHDALKSIQATFGVGWDPSRPAMLFFQVHETGKSYEGRLVSFRDDNQDNTFAAMKGLLEIAANSLAMVQERYASNSEELFNLVDGAISNRVFKERSSLVVKAISTVKGLLF